ncbi:MAG: hypothetical protein HT580_09750 [Dechloromonas sp.]|nr:MAG: hypothetical protein HT580_09750 [Dechloromonas sp.]
MRERTRRAGFGFALFSGRPQQVLLLMLTIRHQQAQATETLHMACTLGQG